MGNILNISLGFSVNNLIIFRTVAYDPFRIYCTYMCSDLCALNCGAGAVSLELSTLAKRHHSGGPLHVLEDHILFF